MLKQMFLVMFELMFLVMFKQADPPPPPSQMGAPPGAYEVAKELKVSCPQVAVHSGLVGKRPHPVFPPTSAHSPLARGLRGDVPGEYPGDAPAGLPVWLASVARRPYRYRQYGRYCPRTRQPGG